MGRIRDLFKIFLFEKIRDTKGTFHAKMGTMKDRNGMNLTESGDIKRWQEYIEELWTEVHDIGQEAKTISKKNKCKKGKWLFKEALQIAEKRKDLKGKGEKERYTN